MCKIDCCKKDSIQAPKKSMPRLGFRLWTKLCIQLTKSDTKTEMEEITIKTWDL